MIFTYIYNIIEINKILKIQNNIILNLIYIYFKIYNQVLGKFTNKFSNYSLITTLILEL